MAKDEKKDAVKAAKKPAAKKAPAKKEDAKGGRRGPIRYVKDVWLELKKVMCFVAAFTLIIWLMDLAVTPAFKWLVG